MSWKRLRIAALSQLKAIKDRLDSIDAEMLDDRLREYLARRAAERELEEALGGPSPTGPDASVTPAGEQASTPLPRNVGPQPGPSREAAAAQHPPSVLARCYRVLGLPEGSGLPEVEGAYQQLLARCDALAGPEGSEERQIAEEIRSRIEQAYATLREALNPAAGRFDRLEL